MSYQTSIHFDPTALLIIKNEVDNSISQVEIAVSTLAEDQALPFGIDDALLQLEQCAQVLNLIGMSNLAKTAEYSALLMRKIMGNPSEINTQDIIALSEGTNMLKRYIEFICLREVEVPEFLLDTLNRLEIALGKPITQEGYQINGLLGDIIPNFDLPQAPSLEKSQYIHRLYKLALSKLLKQEETPLDLQAFKIIGAYLAGLSQDHPSKQYWHLVYYVFENIEQLIINEPRLRTFIEIESNIRQYFENPECFKANLNHLSNILSLAIRQEDNTSQHIREQLNIGDTLLTDLQLQVFSRHLYGPDHDTIHTISELLSTEMAQLRVDIEYNYQTMSPEKTQELQAKIKDIANIFHVLNLTEAHTSLIAQAQELNNVDVLKDENFAQKLMNELLAAMNAIGILERHHTSNRLQLRVNNRNIALDRLDDAHATLLNEAKLTIDLITFTLEQHLKDQELEPLANIPAKLEEVAGALLFLNVVTGQNALKNSADFVAKQIKAEKPLSTAQVHGVFDTLASADMLIENLKNKQPVLQSMFDVALVSSEKLKSVA
ncbi:chemotaxis protein [Acinetobacter faecalis]|uniref:chemotaxis protein n=1 Tax=Acinetobacter faecalis TaxID=2665161 RepID=UPI002A91891D|nr:chemotaxis protein [Acinetobacter faecalis]MDY6467062.1 chemotaxis protein [Acinetobacter faecalis]MDY6481144.1 chemotaxis protein [Acinetobacter faecalis]